MKLVLVLTIFFLGFSVPVLGALTDADLDKIRLIVNASEKRIAGTPHRGTPESDSDADSGNRRPEKAAACQVIKGGFGLYEHQK